MSPGSNPLLLKHQLDSTHVTLKAKQLEASEIGIREKTIRERIELKRAVDQELYILKNKIKIADDDLSVAESEEAAASRNNNMQQSKFDMTRDCPIIDIDKSISESKILKEKVLQLEAEVLVLQPSMSDSSPEILFTNDLKKQITNMSLTLSSELQKQTKYKSQLDDFRNSKLEIISNNKILADELPISTELLSELTTELNSLNDDKKTFQQEMTTLSGKWLTTISMADRKLAETDVLAVGMTLQQVQEKIKKLTSTKASLTSKRESLRRFSGVSQSDNIDMAKMQQIADGITTATARCNQLDSWLRNINDLVSSETLTENINIIDEECIRNCSDVFSNLVKSLVSLNKAELSVTESKGLVITLDDKPASLFSGGQKTIIALCFLLAVSTISNTGNVFYLLDEVDAALDEANQASVASLVARALPQKQIICVTHHPAFKKLASKIFHVQNIAGYSVLLKTSEIKNGADGGVKKRHCGASTRIAV